MIPILASELFGKQWISKDIDIRGITCDSRMIKPGDVFVCIKGYKDTGYKYVDEAIKNGASAIVADSSINAEVPVILCYDPRKEMAKLAKMIYEYSDDKITLIGVTGTNGKTTVTHLLRDIFENSGISTALIGTNGCYLGYLKKYENITASTTPDVVELIKTIKNMQNSGAECVSMEVSSHALTMDRVSGIEFDVGVFTNLTQDHLDFHKTMENYFNAKRKLFEKSKFCVINTDDEYGKRLYDEFFEKSLDIGFKDQSIHAFNIEYFHDSVNFDISDNGKIYSAKINIPGRFSVYNALSAYAAARKCAVPSETIINALSKTKGVKGRCETKFSDKGFSIVIDYAHTPDGLENIISSVREYTKGRIITVFGCGGNRDEKKRPIMGAISAKLSDITVITSDNPRFEDPMKITEDIISGIKDGNYVVIPERSEAIKYALSIAKENDSVILAGKGHEDYVIKGDKKIHFDEREIIKEFFDKDIH